VGVYTARTLPNRAATTPQLCSYVEQDLNTGNYLVVGSASCPRGSRTKQLQAHDPSGAKIAPHRLLCSKSVVVLWSSDFRQRLLVYAINLRGVIVDSLKTTLSNNVDVLQVYPTSRMGWDKILPRLAWRAGTLVSYKSFSG